MSRTCSDCGVEISGASTTCPVCGENQRFAESSLNMTRKLVAAISYLTFIPATIFLFSGHFKTDRFVRFHSFQSIFLVIAVGVLAVISRLVLAAFSFIPFLIATLVVVTFCLGALVLWVLLMVKALQGQRFKLPWIGEIAERQAYT
jgi:uncharacterized membrane protein